MALQLLIIDDSELNLKLTELMLRKIDCHTDTFSDVREALRSVKDHDYDLVFMDYLMPDIDGIEATRLIRSMTGGVHSVENYYEKLPVIALTAEEDSFLQRRMIDSGINDVLLKPFRLDTVCAIIDKWCGTDLSDHAAHRETPSASHPDHDPDAILPGISGITESTLREMLSVDRDGFYETLKLFVDDAAGKHKRINDAIAGEDYQTYCVEVHRVKGEAAIIGAYMLSEDASRLNELGKALLRGDFDPSKYEEKLAALDKGTSALLTQLDDLCSSAKIFLAFVGQIEPREESGVLSSLSQTSNGPVSTGGAGIDREKLLRYISHAKEALDSGDTALAREWLSEIAEHLKK